MDIIGVSNFIPWLIGANPLTLGLLFSDSLFVPDVGQTADRPFPHHESIGGLDTDRV